MALSSQPLAEAQSLHYLGWISLRKRDGKYGHFWTAKPFEAARRVYSIDIEEVRSRIATVVREERKGKHCFYTDACDRFAWMSEQGDDLLLPILQQLQTEGLVKLDTVGKAMTVVVAPTAIPEKLEEPSAALPSLEDSDYALLNQLEDLETTRINFGVFDHWTSSSRLARLV